MARTTRQPLRRLEAVVLIAVGGFAGSNLRYLVDLVVSGMAATLTVNALGSFALGFVAYEALRTDALASETRFVISTGFISSFTTYSTFALQSAQATLSLLVANVVATYVLGFLGVFGGRELLAVVQRRWSR